MRVPKASAVWSRRWLSVAPSLTPRRRTAALKLPSSCPSLLDSILKANNVLLPRGPFKRDPEASLFRCTSKLGPQVFDKENLVPFLAEPNGTPVGFLRPQVSETLSSEKDLMTPSGWGVSLKNGWDYDARTAYINDLVGRWKKRGLFDDILRGWSDELFPVYEHWTCTSRLAFSIERAALPLFGLPNYGCLMTGYFVCPKTNETWIWIPRRSRRKKTWPGKLDVTVGGGLDTGETPLSTIIRESVEEASFDEALVSSSINPAGLLTLHNRNPSGWLLPGVYYLFDLELPEDNSIQPKLTVSAEEGGEVESFELMSAQEVLDNIAAGEFKSSSALALMDFLVRHGLYTSETDEKYVEVCMELRQRFY
ncbi:hypothetical protein VKT23_001517 [Stygiomarasmius scandens]|uniref:Nudix hydrolase domain-containing protein n=1 Tax=Marasmiellus scandens TaxID=2682957 RepID=A0ABR1K183_9AGAR